MPSVSEMQHLVSEQKSINSRLRNELYELENGVRNAHKAWDRITARVNNTLINGNSRVKSSHELTLNAYELQCDIEKIYKLFKYVESANKKIRELQNKIYYDFANYNAVRKIVGAMLNNIEVTFVSDAVLTKAIEIKHLQLPDYWLTCALLSIMAWKNDDRPMAEKALERACKLDKKNTCIFFFAFYMRIGKDPVALKWFNHYITCELTGEDNRNILFMFSLLSKTTGIECDDQMYAAVDGFVNQLIGDRLNAEGYSEQDMIARIVGYYRNWIIAEQMNYPTLKKYCKESAYLQDILSDAKNNEKILAFIKNTVNVTAAEKNNRLNEFIDDIIRRSNRSEVEVRNEIYYNELVINYKGDVEKAKADYATWLEHNANQLDVISEMVDWVYRPGDEEINALEKQRLFMATKNLSQKAADSFAESYRRRVKNDFDIQINEYASHADLTNESEENGKIDQYFNTKSEQLIAQQKIWPSFIWFGAGVLGAVGAFALSVYALLIVTLVGIAGGVGHILLTNRSKKIIAQNCRREAENTKNIFAGIMKDYSKYQQEYQEYDKYYDDIKEEFSKL